MPNTKISALTAGNPAQGTDEIPIARGAANFKVTAASIAALSPAGTVTSVAVSGGTTGLTTSGGPITASGTITLAGTLALANGGTGQTTKAAAFNALSPVTSTGDLIIGNGSNSNTRLAIGGFNEYLRSNGTTASWSSISVSAGDIAGTLQTYQGGTGTSSSPSSGQLLIGTSFSSYQLATLTAGTGISVTSASGAITIAATGGGGGTTINVLSVSTSSGSFNNSPPSSTSSKPLIGNTTSPSNYGAFAFQNNSGGNYITSASVSTIAGLDSTGASFSYSNGMDFSSGSAAFSVMDSIVGCYGILIMNPTMQTLFASSKASITAPSLAPLDASTIYGGTNPYIYVSDGTNDWDNNNGGSLPSMGIVVQVNTGTYNVYFGTDNTTFSSSIPVSSIQFTVNSSFSSYFSGSDFSVMFAQNTTNGMFQLVMTVANPTMKALLDNSFKAG